MEDISGSSIQRDTEGSSGTLRAAHSPYSCPEKLLVLVKGDSAWALSSSVLCIGCLPQPSLSVHYVILPNWCVSIAWKILYPVTVSKYFWSCAPLIKAFDMAYLTTSWCPDDTGRNALPWWAFVVRIHGTHSGLTPAWSGFHWGDVNL